MGKINPQYHQTVSQIQNEFELINKAKNNPEYFEPLYNKYYEQIFRFVHHRSINVQITKDIVSQIFLKALINIKTYKNKGVPFSSWLYRIAHNETIQWHRQNNNHRAVTLKSDDLVSEINEIDEKDLVIIELRYFEKRSVIEVSEILNISESNAKVRCHRAINRLRSLLLNKIKMYETK